MESDLESDEIFWSPSDSADIRNLEKHYIASRNGIVSRITTVSLRFQPFRGIAKTRIKSIGAVQA